MAEDVTKVGDVASDRTVADDRTVAEDKAPSKGARKSAAEKTVASEAKASASRKASAPEMVGKYKVESVIAQGGMGVVYKAMHPSLKRNVIIKKLTIRGNASIRERFKREAQILLDLQNPYIVHLHDYFVEGSSHYIVEELVDGIALDGLIKRYVSLPSPIAMVVFLDACKALRYAHSKGIVHRDIKPGNILISKKAEVKLADFGIASSEKEETKAKDEGASNLTQSGMTLGTPAYMSPEQFEDSSTVDQRADVYAMGVMLYEMVTGTKPYPGNLTPDTMLKIQKSDYIPPEKIDKSIPLAIGRLIRKMLQADKEKRFQSMDPVINRVSSFLRRYDTHALRVELARAVRDDKDYEFPEIQQKKRTAFKIALGAALGAVLIVAGVLLYKDGFFHRTILRPMFTPVTLSLDMPATSTDGADLNVQAWFFENDNMDKEKGRRKDNVDDIKIPPVSNPNFRKRVFYESKDSSQSMRRLVTKPVSLRPGDYRIKVVVGQYIWWQTFTVGEKEKEKEVKLDFLKKVRSIPLNIVFNAYDTEGNKIERAGLYVDTDGKGGKSNWLPYTTLSKDRFVTGRVWKFRVARDGYEDEFFSLTIDWFQSELYLTAVLNKKKPAEEKKPDSKKK